MQGQATSTESTPLAATIARLAEIQGEQARVSLTPPEGDRWLRLDQMLESGLDLLFEDAASSTSRRDYIGAVVASALTDALVAAGWPALLMDRRLPDLATSNIAVRRGENEIWFDRIALESSGCTVLTGDADAMHQTVSTVSEVADLHALFAAALVEAVEPWFAEIRARAPFGRRGMWGQLADDVCASALWTAAHSGSDQRTAWDEAQVVLDLIADRVPEMRGRPQLYPVRWSGGERLFQVKSTCCLWYVTDAAKEYGDDAYCSSCPLRDDASRSEKLAGTTATTAGARGACRWRGSHPGRTTWWSTS